MNAGRTAQSCKLIKEYVTRHQVIFLTCKEDYIDTLGGESSCSLNNCQNNMILLLV